MSNLLSVGNSSRHVAATKMNAESSRSHAIFLLELVQANARNPNEKGKKSIVNMVDLAGSERSGAAGTSGTTLAEGSNINKSLSTLGSVIQAHRLRSLDERLECLRKRSLRLPEAPVVAHERKQRSALRHVSSWAEASTSQVRAWSH